MTKIVLCGALLSLIPLSAQDLEKVQVEKKLAEVKAQLGGWEFMSGQMLSGKTVKGAPYSARTVNETVQTLADGNHITNTSSSTLYRDSQGRERREELSGGANPRVRSIFITDPVDGVSYSLETHSKIAHKNSPSKLASAEKTRMEKTETHTRILVSTNNSGGPVTINFAGPEFDYQKVDSKVENLGMQVIEGVPAEGTRTTITMPPGQIGNEQPIVTVSERWYSPDLQVVVMTKRNDPRTGSSTYKLTNIDRSEPAHSLFEVPADYTVNDTVNDMMGGPIRVRRPEEEQ